MDLAQVASTKLLTAECCAIVTQEHHPSHCPHQHLFPTAAGCSVLCHSDTRASPLTSLCPACCAIVTQEHHPSHCPHQHLSQLLAAACCAIVTQEHHPSHCPHQHLFPTAAGCRVVCHSDTRASPLTLPTPTSLPHSCWLQSAVP